MYTSVFSFNRQSFLLAVISNSKIATSIRTVKSVHGLGFTGWLSLMDETAAIESTQLPSAAQELSVDVRVGVADDAHRTCGEHSALLEAAVGQPRAGPDGGTATELQAGLSRLADCAAWSSAAQTLGELVVAISQATLLTATLLAPVPSARHKHDRTWHDEHVAPSRVAAQQRWRVLVSMQ